MYVAGFERGVRPMGAWSMEITLSIASRPVIESHAPMGAVAEYSLARAAGSSVSMTRLDFPLPETPVTVVKRPSGMSTVTFRKL